jgi:hypothetical protein
MKPMSRVTKYFATVALCKGFGAYVNGCVGFLYDVTDLTKMSRQEARTTEISELVNLNQGLLRGAEVGSLVGLAAAGIVCLSKTRE